MTTPLLTTADLTRRPPTAQEVRERLERLPQVRRWRQKDYTPGPWLTDDGAWESWGHTFRPTRRGMNLVEMNRADPHAIPEQGPGLIVDREGGAAPGSRRYDYPLKAKYQSWTDNVESLFEEAVSRQWSATTDIPWDQLEPLPEDQERALCQLLTFLHAVEFGPTEVLPYYMARIDPAFPEVRQFLATQCADEARHAEVFGKRVMANGGGPGGEANAALTLLAGPQTTVIPPEAVATVTGVRPQAEFLAYSFSTQLLGEAVVLDMFRFGEFLGRNPCDKMIFRRVMQDEARHVSFGTMRVKYYLEHAPAAERARALEMLHFLASVNEAATTGFSLLINPRVIEPFALLAAGSLTNLDKGWDIVREYWARVVENYLERCERAGMPRWDRCLIPREAPF
jgi:hypothetical protein